MVDQVLADGRVPSGQERELQFGADAVGRGHQHRFAVSAQGKTAAKAADIGQNAAGEGLARHGPDGRDGAVSLVDADPRVLITDPGFLGDRRFLLSHETL